MRNGNDEKHSRSCIPLCRSSFVKVICVIQLRSSILSFSFSPCASMGDLMGRLWEKEGNILDVFCPAYTLHRFLMEKVWECSFLAYRLLWNVFPSGIKWIWFHTITLYRSHNILFIQKGFQTVFVIKRYSVNEALVQIKEREKFLTKKRVITPLLLIPINGGIAFSLVYLLGDSACINNDSK